MAAQRLAGGGELGQGVADRVRRGLTPGGGRLGLCGDRFAPGGGVQAAFLSGQRLARRLLAAEATA